jgi:hypothetical protein
MNEIIDEAVKLHNDFPELSFYQCVEIAKVIVWEN